MKINNVPSYAWSKYYMVIREVDGERWFYGAWKKDEGEKAMQQAKEVGGELIHVIGTN